MQEDDDGPEDDIFALDCPSCGETQDHRVLRAAAAAWTLQCLQCKAVRTAPAPPRERTVEVPAILSDGATARTIRLTVPVDGMVRPDDEFDFEGRRVRVTAVETVGGQRPESAPGRDIKVLYAVLFDTVALHYTVNQGEKTESFREDVAPEEEVHVGVIRVVQGIPLLVETLKSDQNRTLHRGFLLARSIRRVFADLAPAKARAGHRMATRRRGKPTAPAKPRTGPPSTRRA